MKKTNLPKKKLELTTATVKALTDLGSLEFVVGGLRCASSESNGRCSGNVNC